MVAMCDVIDDVIMTDACFEWQCSNLCRGIGIFYLLTTSDGSYYTSIGDPVNKNGPGRQHIYVSIRQMALLP